MSTSCCCSSSTPIAQRGGRPLPMPQVKSPGSAHPSGYTVVGMTCGRCVASVTEQVGAVPGVEHVVVDLASGSLSFAAERPVSRAAVQAAVERAGYRLA